MTRQHSTRQRSAPAGVRRGERLGLLLAAGLSLGVHATAAIWFGRTAPAEGLAQPPARVIEFSVLARRAATPADSPEPAPAAQSTAVPSNAARSAPPPPLPLPEPRQASRPAPQRTAPAQETAAALPAQPRATAHQETDTPSPPESAAAAPAAPSAAESYLARLLAHIDSHKFYPRGARRRGQEGDIGVVFYLLQDGGIRALEVSGDNRLLREAAKRAVHSALPLPKPPPSLDLHERVSFSMRFRLNG